MPKHWWLLVGDNPDKKKHEENLRNVIEQAGGEVLFIGFDPSKRNPDKPNAASKSRNEPLVAIWPGCRRGK